jgi:hypothetical protein
MRALFGRNPGPDPERQPEVTMVVPPAEPPVTPRPIDRARLIRLFDQWTRTAQQCGAKELANMIQDERIEMSRRPVNAVPGRAS